ncbi:ribonuclease HI [Pontiella sp.]|uniref:ribonuclease HI n=1 Tax=Pontiella sp. TaxID=2837462 RepID=UPI0035613052
MTPLILFTDGSVHPPSRVGYGAYLAVTDLTAAPDDLLSRVCIKSFEDTSSSQLEVETLLWALREIQPTAGVIVYTDSQNMIGLPARRERLECKPHNHAALYHDFFAATDQFDCTFVKVKGHRKADRKTETDRLFTLVDRASRRALRADPRCN